MPRKKRNLSATGEKRPSKLDMSRNGSFNHKHTDNGKVAFRVNERTVILVSPEKATESYAKEYREKMELL